MLSAGLYLAGLEPRFRAAVGDWLIPWANYLGYVGTISSGYRSQGEQYRLYLIGRTPEQVLNRVSLQGRNGSVTDAWPGSSPHNYGLAIDVEGRDQAKIRELAQQMGFGIVSWDAGHIEWPNWRQLLG